MYTDCGLVSSSPGVLEVGGGSSVTLPFWMMHYCLRSPGIVVEVGVVTNGCGNGRVLVVYRCNPADRKQSDS